jgi:hypothetical protein
MPHINGNRKEPDYTMGKQARKSYLKAIRARYHQGGRAAKRAILNEFCEVCGYARKYAIRLLNRKPDEKYSSDKRPGAKPKYVAATFMEPLRRIWFASDNLAANGLRLPFPYCYPITKTNRAPWHKAFALICSGVGCDLGSIAKTLTCQVP